MGITFFTSMVGISGAFLLVPFQISLFGFASPSASATNLVFNLIAIPGGIYRYWRENRLFLPLALIITLGGIPGTLIGVWLRTHWLAERAAFEIFVAVILFYLAVRMLLDLRRKELTAAVAEPVRLLDWNRHTIRFVQGEHTYAFGVPSMLGLSFLIAIIGSAYGVGGGAFMVPLCLTLYGLPLHAIAGATLTATLLTSGFALAAYIWLPVPAGVIAQPDGWLGLAFGLGGLVGAYLGARCQRYVSQRVLRGFLTLLLFGLALDYIWPSSL